MFYTQNFVKRARSLEESFEFRKMYCRELMKFLRRIIGVGRFDYFDSS